MPLDKVDLDAAVARGAITREQADALRQWDGSRQGHHLRADLSRLFQYPAVAVLESLWALGVIQVSAPFLLGQHPTGAQRSLLSAALGFLLLAIGVLLDAPERRRFTTWLYGSALIIFRIGVAGVGGVGAGAIALHLSVDLALLLSAFLLRRPIFALAGALGAAASLGALVEAVGLDVGVPGVIFGLAAAWLGAAYLGRRVTLEDRLARWLPAALVRVLPGGRRL
jgi:hypothetical protein